VTNLDVNLNSIVYTVYIHHRISTKAVGLGHLLSDCALAQYGKNGDVLAFARRRFLDPTATVAR
jgi:hypothetical protein